MPQEFKIQSENPWDSIVIPDGAELVEGTKVYEGEETVLIDGKETKMARRAWSGNYLLENGKSVEVAEGVITEVNDVPMPEASMKEKAAEVRKKFK